MSVRKITLMSGKYMTENKIVTKINVRKMNVRQRSVRKMSCQVDVMSGKWVQEFEPEPFQHTKLLNN